MVVSSYYVGAEGLSIAMAMTLVTVAVWRLAGGAEGFVRDVTAGSFVAGYVPLLGSFVLLMLAESDGAWRVVTFIATATFSDIGGYAAGVLFGRHAMAPRISPKKSWEGFCGSVVASMVVGWLLVTTALEGPAWVGLLLGAVVAVTATTGDLVESLIKRDLGIKDMGTLLPGHGGVMDRLDSLLVAAPVCWLLLQLVEVT
jgi:phosphatidate cytidylyltransferase